MSQLDLDPRTAALILIDLQHGIVARETAPYPAATVVSKCAELATAFRSKGATVVYVHVDLANPLKVPADSPMRDPNAPPPPAAASEIVPEAGLEVGDLVILKRQWGAFFGTNLESLLEERGIRTVVIAGIATNFGVESTARAAAGIGLATVLVEDAMSSMSAELHRFAIENIFPRMGRVRSAQQVIAGLQ